MANDRFTISISSRDSELIEFIKEKRKNGSLSAYIRGLIRQDMGNREVKELEQIYLYIEKKLRESGFAIKDIGNGQVKGIVDDLDKEVILNLF